MMKFEDLFTVSKISTLHPTMSLPSIAFVQTSHLQILSIRSTIFASNMPSSVLLRPARAVASRGARAFHATARASATPLSPLEPHNSLEPVYDAIEERLNIVRSK